MRRRSAIWVVCLMLAAPLLVAISLDSDSPAPVLEEERAKGWTAFDQDFCQGAGVMSQEYSPYYADNATIVLDDCDLLIESGVTVLMDSGSRLRVTNDSSLTIEGEYGSPVVFSPVSEGGSWHGISLFDQDDDMEVSDYSELSMRYAIMEGGGIFAEGQGTLERVIAAIQHSEFYDSSIISTDHAHISLNNSYLYNSTAGAGIVGAYEPSFSASNSTFVGGTLIPADDGILRNNSLEQMEVPFGDWGGTWFANCLVESSFSDHLIAPIFEYNTFIDSTIELYESAMGSGSVSMVWLGNNFLQMGNESIILGDIGSGATVDMYDHWWGTTDTDVIDGIIHDENDDPSDDGEILYLPIAQNQSHFPCQTAGSSLEGQFGNGQNLDGILSASHLHTCGILDDGSAWCWGGPGLLGDGTNNESPTPVSVILPTGRTAVSISAGGRYQGMGWDGSTCAVLDDGSAWCWGDNGYGQLGDGSAISSYVPVPVDLPAGGVTISVSVGGIHACAVLGNGSAWCWGDNTEGQLGDGSTSMSSVPVPVDLPEGRTASSISAGGDDSDFYFTCAILDYDLANGNETAYCWGDNTFGQLGVSPSTNQISPVAVALPTGRTAISVSSGGMHACSILDDGSAWCWGDNGYGQLGDGTSSGSGPTQVNIPAGRSVISISSGWDHSCAALDNGSVYCWGEWMEFFDSPPNIEIPVAIAIPDGGNAIAVTAGGAHSCAVLDDGSAWCWGDNAEEQLGNVAGDWTITCTSPYSDNWDDGYWVYAHSGEYNSSESQSLGDCYQLVDGDEDGNEDPPSYINITSEPMIHLTCTLFGVTAMEMSVMVHNGGESFGGYNECNADDMSDNPVDHFATLNATDVPGDSSVPIRVSLPPGMSIAGAGSFSSSGVTIPVTPQEPSDPPILTNATAVSVGHQFVCAIIENGSAYCWGDNFFGQLGSGVPGSDMDTSNVPVNVRVPVGFPVVSISAGKNHACAVLGNGSAYCWGVGADGQLGDGSNFDTHTPWRVLLPEGSPAVSISSGGSHTCAVMGNGSAYCWGGNYHGQVGFGENQTNNAFTPRKVQLPAGSTAVSISAGVSHTCAVLENGSAYCWGLNHVGQIGDGSSNGLDGNYIPISVILPENSVAVEISAGGPGILSEDDSHSCGLLDNASLYCWGDNGIGQLGIGNAGPYVDTPQLISAGVYSMSVGSAHTCALTAATAVRSVMCWGANGLGQLGDGTNSMSSSPVVLDITASSISSGQENTCAIIDDSGGPLTDFESGSLACWGDNDKGQLGDGTNFASNTPVLVENLTGHTNSPSGSQDDSDEGQVEVDADGDGVVDQDDACPGTNGGVEVNLNGCADYQRDSDGDGINDRDDSCPNTNQGLGVDGNGCADYQRDSDGDGYSDAVDSCPGSSNGSPVDSSGCAAYQRDTDEDGVNDAVDTCPGTNPPLVTLDVYGCTSSQRDSDGDGYSDATDSCPGTGSGDPTDGSGCSAFQLDGDGDGVSDALDQCLFTGPGVSVGADGCDSGGGLSDPSDDDEDGDGVLDSSDDCLGTGQNESVNFDGCSHYQLDSDGDGISNANDSCALTPGGLDVDVSGCAAEEVPMPDIDADGVPDSLDSCPGTGMLRPVDSSGCNAHQTDSDGDGVVDSLDDFPSDPGESQDSDFDGVGDNSDAFPLDYNETKDSDGDGIGDNSDPDADGNGILDELEGVPVEGDDASLTTFLMVGLALAVMAVIGVIVLRRGGADLEIPNWARGGDAAREVASSEIEYYDDRRIQSRFRKSELVGEGGMANVYRATEQGTGARFIWKEAAASRFNPLPEVNRRLADESEILSTLNHPRIPRHIGYGEFENEDGDKIGAMVMEFIDGRPLSDVISTLNSLGRGIDVGQAVPIIGRVCEPLEYMADLDPPVYHRDVKPSNVLMDPNKGVVLIDFGLAKGVDAGADVSLSRGLSEGWSPPERRDGVSGGFTDVFSLGQMLWQMLTGQRPFHALSLDEISKILESRGHPDWIASLIHDSVQRHDRRIQSVLEFRIRLENQGEIP